jgi:DNA-binding response OmpR family regulator
VLYQYRYVVNPGENALHAISLVEDNPALLSIYKDAFEQVGCRVSAYASANSALSGMLAGDVPRLILIDYLLPDMDAESFIKKLNDGIPDLPKKSRLIVFSSLDSRAPQIQRLLPYISQFIPKPIDLVALEDLAKNLTSDLH